MPMGLSLSWDKKVTYVYDFYQKTWKWTWLYEPMVGKTSFMIQLDLRPNFRPNIIAKNEFYYIKLQRRKF